MTIGCTPDVLCNVLDVYYANYNLDDRPMTSAIGVTNTRYGQNDRSALPKGNGKWNAPPTEKNPIVASSQVTHVTPQSKPVVLPFNQSTVRRCFNCQSPSHLIGQCPRERRRTSLTPRVHLLLRTLGRMVEAAIRSASGYPGIQVLLLA